MARKRTEAKPAVSADGTGAAPAPAKRTRPSRTKSAAPPQNVPPAPEVAPVSAPEPQPSFTVPHAAEQAAAVAVIDVEAAPKPETQPFLDPEAEREEIARIAYSYWLARGGQGGAPEEDWARAEQEYRSRRNG